MCFALSQIEIDFMGWIFDIEIDINPIKMQINKPELESFFHILNCILLAAAIFSTTNLYGKKYMNIVLRVVYWIALIAFRAIESAQQVY